MPAPCPSDAHGLAHPRAPSQERLRRLAPEARAKELERQQKLKQRRQMSKLLKRAR